MDFFNMSLLAVVAFLLPWCAYWYLGRISLNEDYSEQFKERARSGWQLAMQLNLHFLLTLEQDRLARINTRIMPQLAQETLRLIREDKGYFAWAYLAAFYVVWGMVRLKTAWRAGPHDLRPLVGFEMLVCGR